MSNIKVHIIPLNTIKKASRVRPYGYFKDVVSKGVVVGGDLHISEDAYWELRRKYSGDEKPVGDSTAVVPRKRGCRKSELWGPRWWAVLHLHSLVVELAGGKEDDSAWLQEFTNSIPGQECLIHWKQLLIDMPPDFKNYFDWTTVVHNCVNQRLDAPIFSSEDSRKHWMAVYRQIQNAEMPSFAIGSIRPPPI